ncbi:MAG: glycogen/starch synthase, partial [Candidatus Woesearchaeota archaeon]
DYFKIDSLNCPDDVTEPMVWGYATGIVIEKLSKVFNKKNIVAHFHEWLSATALLYLKIKKLNVACVFTTHATILGRSIAASQNLYDIIEYIEPEEEARKYWIITKYHLEKQAAHNSDIFSTVSEITGHEAEHLLKKKPDILLPNGLPIEDFPSFEDASIKHREMKFRIKEFMLYYFFPYTSFNIDETLIYFIFCRYEFKNKGIDVFIKALKKLNEKLKEINSEKTIVTFFFVPTSIKSIKSEIIENKDFYEDIKESVDLNINDIRNRILINLVEKEEITKEKIFSEEFLEDIKRKVLRFNKKGEPVPLCTHDLNEEKNDPIIKTFLECNLNNKEEDKVKVVFYPTYLTGADGLLNLDYYETIIGGHLGVFPSIYEPWGYTPLEAGALGVASVTTDLSGFGQFVNKNRPEWVASSEKCNPSEEKGIYVIRRKGKSEEEVVEQLFEILYYYSQLTKSQRIDNKLEARKIASFADWKILINNYIRAHNLALEKIKKQ